MIGLVFTAAQKKSAARFLMRYLPSGPGIEVKTIAIGSFGLRPGPPVRRFDIWPSSKGVTLDMSSKILAA
jgi:hypothetical protein